MTPLSRRSALLLGAAALLPAAASCTTAPAASVSLARVSVAQWRGTSGPPHFVGHRGAGVLVPEHTLPGYERALGWGLRAIEVSVVQSRDGVLFCQHDLTMDRTTTLTGRASDLTAKQIDAARVQIPRLGPAWSGDRRPVVPRLSAVLDAVGGRAVLCIEAKTGLAFDPMIQLLRERGLLDTILVKTAFDSPTLLTAKELGLPVFGYLGSAKEATPGNIVATGRRLDAALDVMVLPTRFDGRLIPDNLIKAAVDTGVPVWVYSTETRAEVAHYSERGVSGFVTPGGPYLLGTLPAVTRDGWDAGELTPGMMTVDPYSESRGLGWEVPGAITLKTRGEPAWLTLAHLSPLPGEAKAYKVTLEASVVQPLASRADGLCLTVGTATDASPLASDASPGYLVSLRTSGALEVAAGTDRLATGRAPAWLASRWSRVTLTVTADAVTVERDGVVVTAADRRWRGGYLHVGRSGVVGEIAIRNLEVSPL